MVCKSQTTIALFLCLGKGVGGGAREEVDERVGKENEAGNLFNCQSFLFLSSLAVTPGLVEPHLEGKSLSTALSGNRMFIIDLRYLEGIECTGLREVTH